MDALERIILADPKGNAWKFAKSVYEHIKEIEKRECNQNFVLRELKIEEFPDGEFEHKIDSNSRDRSIIFIHDSSKEACRWLMELILVNDAAMRASAAKVTDVLPYMRWSRGEKKDKPHIPISMKVVANAISYSLLNVAKKRIITMDLHAKASEGFFDLPVDCLESHYFTAGEISKYEPERARNYVPVAPDHGSAGKVRKFANSLGKRLGLAEGLNTPIIDKDRVSGVEIKVHEIIGKEYLQGKIALIIDDIFSSGKTLARGSDALRHYGAIGVDAFVTNFIGVEDYKENLEKLNRVFVTDNFYHNLDGLNNVKIISTAPLFAEAIYAAESGKSISKMFSED